MLDRLNLSNGCSSWYSLSMSSVSLALFDSRIAHGGLVGSLIWHMFFHGKNVLSETERKRKFDPQTGGENLDRKENYFTIHMIIYLFTFFYVLFF